MEAAIIGATITLVLLFVLLCVVFYIRGLSLRSLSGMWVFGCSVLVSIISLHGGGAVGVASVAGICAMSSGWLVGRVMKQLEDAVFNKVTDDAQNDGHPVKNVNELLKAIDNLSLVMQADVRDSQKVQESDECSESSFFGDADDITVIVSPESGPSPSPKFDDSCNMVLASAPVPGEDLAVSSPSPRRSTNNKRSTTTVTYSPSKINKSGIHTITNSQHAIKNKLMKQLEKNGVIPISDPHKLSDEDSVLRALLAKNWDVEAATNMLRHINKWRAKEDINNIGTVASKKFNHSMNRYVDCCLYGVDRDGLPVLWEHCNEKKLNLLLSEHGLDGASLLNTYIAEKCREAAKLLNADRYTVVLDLSTISPSLLLGNVGTVLRSQVKSTQSVYPENMRRCIIYKPPYIFSMIFSVIEKLLDPRVRQKVKVGDSFVKEFIPRKSIPKTFGGSAEWEGMTITTEPLQRYPGPA